MFCPNCRNQIVDNAEFCPNCGTNLKQFQNQPQVQQSINNQQRNNNQDLIQDKRNKKIPIVQTIIIIMIAIVVAVFTFKIISNKKDITSNDNSLATYIKFEAEIYALTKEEGGRHTPFFSNYQPQFYFRETDITGTITLQDGVEMVRPGEYAKVNVELNSSVAIEVGTEFSIREGGRIIGKGTVTKLK